MKTMQQGTRWLIHRKVQDDLECKPIVCVHEKTPNVSQRVFCLWRAAGTLKIATPGIIWSVSLSRDGLTVERHETRRSVRTVSTSPS
jgi:hypothetical protein